MNSEVGEARARAVMGASDETRAAARGEALRTALADARLLLIALWLGAAVFFSSVVAPAAFAALRAASAPQANHLAGSIVTRTLAAVNISGFVIALILLASALLFREAPRSRAFMTELLSLVVVAITTAVGQWLIAARMLALRVAMGRPIDDVPAGDPLRQAFNSLHGLSVMALGVAMIAALVAALSIARRGRANSV